MYNHRMTDDMKLNRFRKYFPMAAFMVNNIWALLPVFGLVAAILYAYSVHYALSLMCVWMGLLCFWIDRKHLNYCLFTPLQPMAVFLIMSLGAGISMVTIDVKGQESFGYLSMQLVGLLGFPLFMLGYFLVTRSVPGFVFPRSSTPGNNPLIGPLKLVGWFCILHELARVLAGVISRTSDRGYGGDFLIDTPFGWWSLFGVFLRIQTMGFLLVPLIWRESRFLGKVGIITVPAVILFLHFVAASRGAVFFPFFIMMVGCYMFLEVRKVKYEVLLVVGIIGLAPIVTLMANYRSSEAFRSTDIRNIFAKVSTIKDGLLRQAEQKEITGQKFTEAGGSFIGVADQYIYEMTPGVVPHEGFERMGDAIWTFIPYIISQGKRPIVQDGYQIVQEYTGAHGGRTSIGITWSAEMYRRWGWAGVPLGLFAYGLFYGAVFRYVYRLYLFKNALWGFMVCGLLFHFFMSWFFHTFLTTFWFWFYDIPKHLALLAVLYFAAKFIYRIRRVPGALRLMSRQASPRPRLGRPTRVAPEAQEV